MTEQFLNDPKIRSPLQQMRRKGVTKRMWTDAVTSTCRGYIATYQSVHATARQPPSPIVDKERLRYATPPARCNLLIRAASTNEFLSVTQILASVSYTHLTLPTSDLV